MSIQKEQAQPGDQSNETHYQKEPKGKQGTMGGQAPLNAPAGIQKAGPGGVLTEKGKTKKEE